MRPTTSCASLNGTPVATNRSATSVASARPDAAASVRVLRNVNEPTTAVTARSERYTVSSVSNTACLSSCRSLLYPLGSPFMVASHPLRFPMTRPVLPRTSSSGSGFFFCGIKLLPVVTASDSPKNPNSSLVKRMKSSANRLKCTIVSEHACRNVETKSRSAVASRLLATTREKPKRRASAAVSMA